MNSMSNWEGNIYKGGSSKEHMLDLSPEPVTKQDYDAAVGIVILTVLVSEVDMLSIHKWKKIIFGALLDSHSMSRKISSAGVDGKFGMSIGDTICVPNDSSFCQEPELFCLVLILLLLILSLPLVLNLRVFMLISYQ